MSSQVKKKPLGKDFQDNKVFSAFNDKKYWFALFFSLNSWKKIALFFFKKLLKQKKPQPPAPPKSPKSNPPPNLEVRIGYLKYLRCV